MEINKMISAYNFKLRTGGIKYIVIHYVGAQSDAKNNAIYFHGGYRGASAHYFVGWSGDIWQSVADQNAAMHCGSPTYKHPECRNDNSIGIEMCCKNDGSKWYFEDDTVAATIELTKELMAKYSIPASNVIRHYDVTGKICPAPYVLNNTKHTWNEFLDKIQNNNSIVKTLKKKSMVTKTEVVMNPEQYIWKELKEKLGLSDIAVAGIIGNLFAESGLRSNNLQNTYEKSWNISDVDYTESVCNKTYTKEQFVNDKAGYGIAQWTFHSRKRSMYEYIVETKNKRIDDLPSQVEFLIKELTGNYRGLLNQLKNVTTIQQASDLVLTQFERPKDQSAKVKSTRSGYSIDIFNRNVTKTDLPKQQKEKSGDFFEFKVRVKTPRLNIRKGPGVDYEKTGKYTGIGTFTIVDQHYRWGLLKAYSKNRDGWICLDYTERV